MVKNKRGDSARFISNPDIFFLKKRLLKVESRSGFQAKKQPAN